jgi:cytochrome P450
MPITNTDISTSPARRAPGPKGGLVLGSLPAYKANPVEFFRGLQRTHGDVVRIKLGPYLAHLVTHPDGIRHVIQTNDSNYCRGRFYEKFKIFFGRGLLTLDGDEWREHRRAAQPAFLRKVVTGGMAPAVDATESMLARWSGLAQRAEPVSMVPEVMAVVLSSLSKTLFGVDVGDQSASIAEAVDFGVGAMFNQGTLAEMAPSWLPTRRNRNITKYRALIDGMISRIRLTHDADRAAVDLVDLLEHAGPRPGGHSWPDREVQDELTTVFLAGLETTAMALAWSLYAVARYPDVRAELEEEVDRVLGSGPLTGDNIDQLVFTRMVISESLRLHPPIWLYTRDALAADDVLGYEIPAGSSVLVSPFVTHRRADLWENAEVFDPHRFDPARDEHRAPFTYFPFGGGPRQCIGLHLAAQELRVMVAMITQRFRLELTNDDAVSVGASVLSLRPLQDIVVRLRPRHPAGHRAPVLQSGRR